MAGCRSLTQEEIDLVLSYLKTPRDKAMFIFGLKSGFRISEILSIRVKDIIQNGKVVARVCVKRGNMKNNETRSVALNPVARDYILELIRIERLEPHHYLFRSRKGDNKPITRVQAHTILKDAFNAAGLAGPVATHSMRKTFAHKVYKAFQHDLIATQKALGQAFITSTIKYLAAEDEKVDEVVNNI